VSSAGDYSEVADKHLDALEAGPDIDLYNAVLDACDLIFRMPDHAQALSTAITTAGGCPPTGQGDWSLGGLHISVPEVR